MASSRSKSSGRATGVRGHRCGDVGRAAGRGVGVVVLRWDLSACARRRLRPARRRRSAVLVRHPVGDCFGTERSARRCGGVISEGLAGQLVGLPQPSRRDGFRYVAGLARAALADSGGAELPGRAALGAPGTRRDLARRECAREDAGCLPRLTHHDLVSIGHAYSPSLSRWNGYVSARGATRRLGAHLANRSTRSCPTSPLPSPSTRSSRSTKAVPTRSSFPGPACGVAAVRCDGAGVRSARRP